jgi:hypothetical protein
MPTRGPRPPGESCPLAPWPARGQQPLKNGTRARAFFFPLSSNRSTRPRVRPRPPPPPYPPPAGAHTLRLMLSAGPAALADRQQPT